MSQARTDDTSVRFSSDLSDGEKEATANRKAKVLQCLKSLGISGNEKTVPNIAVLGSGGGLRAMIALLGTLTEMKKQGLLDAVMYLCGVSGSTWCMSTLYNENDWAEKIEDLEECLIGQLSQTSCDIKGEFDLVRQAAEDELFSLTDVWDAFFVYRVLNKHDPTKLSQHTDASTKGTNPYPIYAAIEKSKCIKKCETRPEIWFEFTPDESGFPYPGAFVSTTALGSIFQNGTLTKQKEEKSIGYLQGLWGSAPGCMEENFKYILDIIMEKIRSLWKEWQDVQFAAAPHSPSDHCRGAVLFLELYKRGSAGENCEEVFGELKEVLKDNNNSKKSHQKCCEVHVTWSSKAWEDKKAGFTDLITCFKTELEGTDRSCGHCQGVVFFLQLHMHCSTGKDCEGVFRELMETHREEGIRNPHLRNCDLASFLDWNIMAEGFKKIVNLIWDYIQEAAEFIWSVACLLCKLPYCLCTWMWGITQNFLYKSDDAQTTDFTNKQLIYLIDAGLANNSAYPLVLRPKRNVKLILSFDFSSGDPFETITGASEYCLANQITFPLVDGQKFDKKVREKPSGCYVFKEKTGPTVMHFPLFNTKNCPGANEIQDSRDKFDTRNTFYTMDDIKELLAKAKKNVSNNQEKILEEIKQIMSSAGSK